MNEKYQNLYKGLLLDTAACWGKALPEIKRTESCFEICLRYWNRLKKLVSEAPFQDTHEEIDFFRQVKPLFTGRLEYYTLVYQYLFLTAGDDAGARADYRRKELKKIAQFRQLHGAFILYLEQGSVDRDDAWFLRGKEEGGLQGATRIFDAGGQWTCPKDGLSTQLAGYALYEHYLNHKANHPD